MYLQYWHGWCHKKLLPSQCVLCTPYNHAPCHFMQSHIRKVYACLAVTCHLCFWQNGWGLLRATAVASHPSYKQKALTTTKTNKNLLFFPVWCFCQQLQKKKKWKTSLNVHWTILHLHAKEDIQHRIQFLSIALTSHACFPDTQDNHMRQWVCDFLLFTLA